ncbi:hypothetical protein DFP72DRAFT_875990 [Ephemerocybe angulata]|uniref:Uncharacterized protein n=1 Tax=Ephemerocybe angulata TaxID=980116 RepID=A0A8H6MAY0_9AGAR|nr:hypothetical protein DFP72DRAFT_875990 [Tulosesus angulatus]
MINVVGVFLVVSPTLLGSLLFPRGLLESREAFTHGPCLRKEIALINFRARLSLLLGLAFRLCSCESHEVDLKQDIGVFESRNTLRRLRIRAWRKTRRRRFILNMTVLLLNFTGGGVTGEQGRCARGVG